MAFPAGRARISWIALALLSGLSVLSWVSTYTGLMELITASSGVDAGTDTRAAVAFAVLMLQLMILYILDALFSRSLRWWLRPLFFLGYAVLLVIAVGFAFGFYWKHLEAGRVATSTAEAQLRGIRQTMQTGATRLQELQTTFAALASISAAKAAQERASGGTCGGVSGRGGKGPRQRLRDGDAQRFRFASAHIARHVAKVKADMATLGRGMRNTAGGAPATTAAIAMTTARSVSFATLNDRLQTIAARFNALRTAAQFLQFRDEFRQRAAQTAFPDGRGHTFSCPDPQLQIALNGAVRAIGSLPELHPPVLADYEGSEAVAEAFRRLAASSLAAWHRLMTVAQGFLARTGVMPEPRPVPAITGGLAERDIIPLLIALFVDFSILLVSIDRPLGRVLHVLTSMDRARDCRLIEFLLPIYRVFAGKFDPAVRLGPAEVISPLVDVVFDHRGKYYAAAPLDFGARCDQSWVRAAANRARRRGEMFVYAPVPRGSAERSRYISSALVVLQGQRLVTLLHKRRALSDEVVRRKLERQGSLYAQADSFRVYAFAPGAWEEFLQATVASGAKAGERNGDDDGKGRRPARTGEEVETEVLQPVRQPWAHRFPDAGALAAIRENNVHPFPPVAAAVHETRALFPPGYGAQASDDGVDFDPSEDVCGGLKFSRGRGEPA